MGTDFEQQSFNEMWVRFVNLRFVKVLRDFLPQDQSLYLSIKLSELCKFTLRYIL